MKLWIANFLFLFASALLASEPKHVRYSDLPKGMIAYFEPQLGEKPIRQIAFSSPAHLMAFSQDNKIQVWRMNQYRGHHLIAEFPGSIFGLAPDGRRIAVAPATETNFSFTLFSLVDFAKPIQIRSFPWISSIEWASDSRLIAIGGGPSPSEFQIQRGSLPVGSTEIKNAHTQPTRGDALIVPNPMEPFFAWGEGNLILTFREHTVITEAATNVLAGQFTPDGQTVLFLLSGGTFRIVDLISPWYFDLDPVTPTPSIFAISPDGKTIALAEKHKVTLWDLSYGTRVFKNEPVGTLTSGNGDITALAFSPQGPLMAGTENGALIVWKTVTTPLRPLQTPYKEMSTENALTSLWKDFTRGEPEHLVLRYNAFWELFVLLSAPNETAREIFLQRVQLLDMSAATAPLPELFAKWDDPNLQISEVNRCANGLRWNRDEDPKKFTETLNRYYGIRSAVKAQEFDKSLPSYEEPYRSTALAYKRIRRQLGFYVPCAK